MESFIQSAIQSSFSIVVAAFLLIRVEKEMKNLAAAIDRLQHCQICKFSDEIKQAKEGIVTPQGLPVVGTLK